MFALAVILFAQAAIGRLSADGQNLLWLHVPLGVALVGLTVQPARDRRPTRGTRRGVVGLARRDQRQDVDLRVRCDQCSMIPG
jgi:hypothetical protein